MDARSSSPPTHSVAACWTLREVKDRSERVELRRAGIMPEELASHADRDFVLTFLRIMARSGLAGREDRHASYRAILASEDVHLARIGARLFATLTDRFATRSPVPEDLHLRRARLLRTEGQWADAVALSDVLETVSVRDASTRRILATTRTGALLDSFDANGDVEGLVQAERSLKIAQPLGPIDEELRNLYRRIDYLKMSSGLSR